MTKLLVNDESMQGAWLDSAFLSRPDAERVLLAAVPVVEAAWKASGEKLGYRTHGKNRKHMLDSFKASKIIGGEAGAQYSIDVYPAGKDSKGVRQAEKAFILNYGTARYPGSEWVDKLPGTCQQDVQSAMAAEFEKIRKEKG